MGLEASHQGQGDPSPLDPARGVLHHRRLVVVEAEQPLLLCDPGPAQGRLLAPLSGSDQGLEPIDERLLQPIPQAGQLPPGVDQERRRLLLDHVEGRDVALALGRELRREIV